MFLPKLSTFLLRLSSGAVKRLDYFGLIFLLFYTAPVFSLPTQTLPKGLRSPAIRWGALTSLDQKYSDQGKLVRLKDTKSIEFDSETLAKFNSRAESLIETLNRFGLYKAGDLFNLGTLEINTQPEINYKAPIFAYGLSANWTIALGIPIVEYKNDIQFRQTFSNVDYYNQFRGLSAELDQALDTDLSVETQKVVQEKGYKPLTSRNETFIGDIQLVSLYQIPQERRQIILQTTMTVPTGPEYDADDLVALNTFHEFSIEQSTGIQWTTMTWLDVMPLVNLKYFIPMQKTMRVPKNSDDVLPDQNTKDQITENKGLLYEVGLQTQLNLSDSFSIKGLYTMGQQQATRYSSSNKGSTDALEKNTFSEWQKVRLDFDYSSVSQYMKSKSGIPYILSLSIFDTIRGKNIERRLGQELNLTLFF